MEIYHEVAPLLAEFSRMGLGDSKELPQIDLYMDQVITLLERNLKDFRRGEKDPLITGTMVNNYAKAKLLPAHNKKKYTGDHVLYLQVIYLLKQVLSTKDIGVLMRQVERETFEGFYEATRKVQHRAFVQLEDEVRDLSYNDYTYRRTFKRSRRNLLRQLLRSAAGREPRDYCGRSTVSEAH